jgi:hypothetical protein
MRRIAGLGGLLALALALCARPAGAEPVDSLRLGPGTPSMPDKRAYDVTKPPAVNSSWAQPDSHPLGVYLPNYNLTREQIDAVEQTGCGVVRLAIPFEPFNAALDADGQPLADDNWLALDQVVSRLSRAGLEILPVLTATVAPDLRQYERFCTAIAERYGPTFKYYQILDNINYTVGLPSQKYADLAAGARLVIVNADPDAVIVSGGIRGCDVTYLDLLDSHGALDSLDVLAFDLYPPIDGIETPALGSMRAHSLPYMQEVMAWARAHKKRVWVTSLGVPTSYDAFNAGVDQVAQASAYARAAILLGHLGVERIIYASIQDTDPDYQNPAQCCGLLDVTGAPKASYYALKALAQLLAGSYQVAPQFHFEASTYARYSQADLFSAAQSAIGSGGNEVDANNPLPTFEVRDQPVYAFWLYNPGSREYRLVYWLDSDTTIEHLLSLSVYDSRMTVKDEHQLLDNGPTSVRAMNARNMTAVQYLPLSLVPTVLRFEVEPNGRAG